jgi:hypothetical protein
MLCRAGAVGPLCLMPAAPPVRARNRPREFSQGSRFGPGIRFLAPRSLLTRILIWFPVRVLALRAALEASPSRFITAGGTTCLLHRYISPAFLAIAHTLSSRSFCIFREIIHHRKVDCNKIPGIVRGTFILLSHKTDNRIKRYCKAVWALKRHTADKIPIFDGDWYYAQKRCVPMTTMRGRDQITSWSPLRG